MKFKLEDILGQPPAEKEFPFGWKRATRCHWSKQCVNRPSLVGLTDDSVDESDSMEDDRLVVNHQRYRQYCKSCYLTAMIDNDDLREKWKIIWEGSETQ